MVAVGLGWLACHTLTTALSPELGLLWLCAALLAIVGLLDDLYELSSILRLILQISVAVVFVGYIGPLQIITLGPLSIELGFLGFALTILWLVGFTNLFNFMDGIDGIAGAMGLLGTVAFTAVLGSGTLAAGTALVGAATLGFLVQNFPPARIFMGDVGSGFLGFLLAGLAVLGCHEGTPMAAFLIILSPFLFDGTLTLSRRVIRGERWYTAHRSHLYQRLTLLGWSHGEVLRVEIPMMLACGGAAILYTDAITNIQVGILVVVCALHTGFALRVTDLEKRRDEICTR